MALFLKKSILILLSKFSNFKVSIFKRFDKLSVVSLSRRSAFETAAPVRRFVHTFVCHLHRDSAKHVQIRPDFSWSLPICLTGFRWDPQCCLLGQECSWQTLIWGRCMPKPLFAWGWLFFFFIISGVIGVIVDGIVCGRQINLTFTWFFCHGLLIVIDILLLDTLFSIYFPTPSDTCFMFAHTTIHRGHYEPPAVRRCGIQCKFPPK